MKPRYGYFILLPLILSLGFDAMCQAASQNGQRHSSLEGLYAVTVPAEVELGGGGPLEEAFTTGLGDGYSTYWNGAEVYLQAGFVNFNEAETIPRMNERTRLFLKAVAKLRSFSNNTGVALQKRQLKINKITVTDLFFESERQTVIYRLFSTSKGIVRLTAIFSSDDGKATGTKFLDSLEAPTIGEIIAEKIREATPEDLPQCDASFAEVTDLFEIGLKGPVKSIALEREEVEDGKVERTLSEKSTFDSKGRLTKKLNYEFNRPDSVDVFGCIDGKRVSKTGYASYEDRFVTAGPPRIDAQPPDKRYNNRYSVLLDSLGRIDQKFVYGNNAVLYTTAKYSYANGTVEIVKTDEDGKVKQSNLQTLDAKGRLVSMVNRSFGSDGTEWRNTYKFVQFDRLGNWIKRNGKYERFENEKRESASNYTEFRSLTYY